VNEDHWQLSQQMHPSSVLSMADFDAAHDRCKPAKELHAIAETYNFA